MESFATRPYVHVLQGRIWAQFEYTHERGFLDVHTLILAHFEWKIKHLTANTDIYSEWIFEFWKLIYDFDLWLIFNIYIGRQETLNQHTDLFHLNCHTLNISSSRRSFFLANISTTCLSFISRSRKHENVTIWRVFAWRPFAFSPRKHVYTTWHKSATILCRHGASQICFHPVHCRKWSFSGRSCNWHTQKNLQAGTYVRIWGVRCRNQGLFYRIMLERWWSLPFHSPAMALSQKFIIIIG